MLDIFGKQLLLVLRERKRNILIKKQEQQDPLTYDRSNMVVIA